MVSSERYQPLAPAVPTATVGDATGAFASNGVVHPSGTCCSDTVESGQVVCDQVAELTLAPVRSAPVRFVLRNVANCMAALLRSAFVRFEFVKMAKASDAPARSALVRSAFPSA